MKRTLFLAYGVACHGLFLLTFAYLMGFVGSLLVPKTINSGAAAPLPWAIAINMGLIVLFGLQHSIMARPAFKKWWTQFIPRAIERSTYVLVSCAVTALLIWQWRPIEIVVWDAPAGALRTALYGLFFTGWLLVPAVSLLINHFDLFGTRQVWLYFRGREYSHLSFRTPGLYAWMRHPLYVGWAIAFWATPTMTVGHLLFALGMSIYMLAAIPLEERDLVAHFGEEYETYRQRVGMFSPRLVAKSTKAKTVHV